MGRRSAFRRTNYEAVINLGMLAKTLHVPRFVSTTDVYSLRDFAGESEDALPWVNNTRNPYPEYKIAAERWIRNELSVERYAIVRPAAVWGIGDKTLTPRAVEFLRTSSRMVNFGRWRGRNRWPLAHVRNVAMANFLAATSPEAAGKAINVLDSEHTSIEEFYHLIADIFLPGRSFKITNLPLWAGQVAGIPVTFISNLLNLDHPFTDPSLYALYSISCNLDFSNRRFTDLLASAQRKIVTRDEGLMELHQHLSFHTC